MRITCPYCHSQANLTPNPAHADRISLPLYLLACSGCDRTSVRRDPVRRDPVRLPRVAFS
ncbi:hypothetical protein E3T54_08790 [Cryobacterium sp. Sr8]|uniref:Uncharacterized protein n=1 Tax=Cryobacterium psychrotolerans TaxID=386301 RepID=A0A1G9AT70_9MICO|nr:MULTISPECIES: hypothetical protein [Cryobacterium]TFD48540.1 hypothetical protein E3T33_01305 [Cryobacterium sp. TMT1-2-1]TFD77183.1 hypothetical protein E3T54_08790 [Cryobacterium sp. Sr8]TFD89553.1 hypothetical protein E3T56_02390 [Cryobacterium psychrotolerans]SDK30074.1 hypothetical protein SAMN05216282_104231 [Cryobacterium psychrotolerans]